MPSESSYWILSVPIQEEKSAEQMGTELAERLVKDGACSRDELGPLPLPPLKTGTLESLITLSEELPRSDAFFTSVTTRIVDTLRALLNNDERALDEHLLVEGESVGDYLMNWHWNNGKYRPDRPLQDMLEALTKEMHSLDNVMKQKLNNYNAAKGALQQLERKKHGNLSVRSLADVVQKHDLVDQSSDFMCTLLVAVPKCVSSSDCGMLTRRNSIQDWQHQYERLAPLVVPRSSKYVPLACWRR